MAKAQGWQLPNRYQVRQFIGTGSYGHVVEAYDSETDRLVAIKRVDRIFEDLIDCKRILREVAMLSSLDSDGVVRLYDICAPQDPETYNELYLVMEICDSDLKKLFRSPVHLSEAMVRLLLYNMLIGLRYIHSAGIYHRDLKPANCLVNQDCSVKICDFGLARAIASRPGEGCGDELPASAAVDMDRPRSGERSAEQAGEGREAGHGRMVRRQLTAHVVTRWYRAPELILLQSHYTEAIDIWSVGCIAAEIFAMLPENVPDPSRRGPLFQGSSCFPLSPEHKRSGNDRDRDWSENRDQLSTIFGVIGTPAPTEVEQLEAEEMRRYISCFPARRPKELAQRFPGSSREGIDLLTRMLAFSPATRITVDEALAHPYFAGIRQPERERVAPGGYVFLPFEQESELDEAKLRRYALLEIKKFHPEVEVAGL